MTTPTIVLIPGLMNDAWVWSAQIGPLSRWGAIHVARTDGGDDLGAMAAAILAATTGPLVAIGHSMGGRVALELAVRAPERLAGLGLLSTGAHGLSPSEAAGRERLVQLAFAQGMAAVADAWLPEMVAPDTTPATRAAITAMLCRCTSATFAAQQRALLRRHDRSDALAGIACPVLVSTGELDALAPPQQHADLARAIPGARLEIVAGAGHMLPVEAPAASVDLLCGLVRQCAAARS